MTDMKHIAAVTEADADSFLSAALDCGEGMGYKGQYKYCVVRVAEDRYMAIFLDCQQELRSVQNFAVISLFVAAVYVTVVYFLIWFFSKRVIEPTARSIEKQKQFITNAGHKLKTPLTVITTSLSVLEMEVGWQKWIDKAWVQTEQMTRLVNDLVTLARLDEERPSLRFAEFDISTVAAVSFSSAWSGKKGASFSAHPTPVPGWTRRSWTSSLTAFTGRIAPAPSRREALALAYPLPGALSSRCLHNTNEEWRTNEA